jgi:hypothetical protein
MSWLLFMPCPTHSFSYFKAKSEENYPTEKRLAYSVAKEVK